MKKRLYLLEWRLCETRAWLGWMVFWMIISFMLLSAMLMTGHLLNKVVLPPVWLFIWCSPWLCFLLKVRVTELDKGLVNTLQLGGLPVWRWSRPVVPGIWSVERPLPAEPDWYGWPYGTLSVAPVLSAFVPVPG